MKIVVNAILALLSIRYILSALGVVDYGLYVVVGGIMSFMGFLTSAMSVSSQRHLAFEIGRGDNDAVGRVFNTCFGLHFLLALVLILLAETIGLWFLKNVLVVPLDRQASAFWVFQFTVVASASCVCLVPYQALLTAHEKFTFIALVGIFQSIINFFVALSLVSYQGDRLFAYGFLCCSITISAAMAQALYSRLRIPESKLCGIKIIKKSVAKDLASFSGWSLFGSLSVVARFQGLAFVLNVFFGPAANATLGIANQVSGAIRQFTEAILQAVSPAIVKQEGLGERANVLSGALITCKFSFFMGCFWALPLFFEMKTILDLWLESPPQEAVLFCRLMIVIFLLDQFSVGLAIPFQAMGKIARYQLVGGTIHLFTLPLAFLWLWFDRSMPAVMYASFSTACINMFMRGYLLKYVMEFSYRGWLKEVFLKGCVSVSPGILFAYVIKIAYEETLGTLIIICLGTPIVTLLGVFLLGMSRQERKKVFTIVVPARLKDNIAIN